MSWLTVPNFFPDYDDLDGETQYHLCEGYCISEYETKKSGKYYKKVRVVDGDNSENHNVLYFLGFWNWHKNYKIRRNPIKRFFLGDWERKRSII